MQSDQESVNVENSAKYKRYLLIIGILALVFSLSFMMRSFPLEYGFELAEFDPFFNYRATEFIVENGLPAYLEWNDDLTWHPYGRDVSSSSQVMLHTTGAVLYQTFGMGSSLYDFTILFPVVISSLTTIIIFGLVRTIGGTTAGMFASLFFAISPIIIMRGSMGWFKSEPLGLFYGLLAVYLLLSGIKSDKGKVSVAKLGGAGILLAFGLASWGGDQFFIIPIGLFFLALPFLSKNNRLIVYGSVIFSSAFTILSMLLEETGIAFISSFHGFFLVGCTAFLVVCVIIKKISKNHLRDCLALLGGTIITGVVIASSGVLGLPSGRYLNAVNPFLIQSSVLVDSVSEHATTTIDISFYFFSILMVFAAIGAWLLFQKKVSRSFKIKDEMAAFALIIAFVGIYISSSFVRLEIFGAISIIILSSIGLSILVSKILKAEHKPTSTVTKISFLTVIIILLVVPMVYPEKANWVNSYQHTPITILNSSSHFDIATNDWPHAMMWLRENTSKDAVIASWWDYGYWISTLAERKTLADNATTLDWQIRKIGTMYMSTPHNAWKILTTNAETDASQYFITLPAHLQQGEVRPRDDVYTLEQWKFDTFKNWKESSSPEIINEYDKKYPTLFEYWESEVWTIPTILTGLDADYVIVNLTAKKLSDENMLSLYTLDQDGGDETKAFWFMKMAGTPVLDYYQRDLQSYTDKFWNDTLIGKLIPFTPIVYVDPDDTSIQSETFRPGYTAIYVKDIKFPTNGDGPFELVYVPPSFERDQSGPLTGPLIYKVNKDYNPNQ